MGIICRAKKYFTRSALINLHNTFILPYMIYCEEVWGNSLSIQCTPAHKITKNIKIITCSKYTPDKNNLYSTTGILPFNVLVKYRIGLLMYKISSVNAPTCLQQLFKSNKDVHTHSTRQTRQLHSMKGKSLSIEHLFFIWNKIMKILTLMYHLFALNTH